MGVNRIAVIGLYRSGSTAAAGMLHHLGADMGAPFWGDFYEPHSLSEKLRVWWNEPWLEQQVDKADRVRTFRNWIEDREASRNGCIGCKHPLLSLCGEDLIEAWGPETRFIWTSRPLQESIDSIVRLNWWAGQGEQLQRTLWDAVQEFFQKTEHLQIEFSETLANPRRQVERLVEYLGLQPTAEQLEAAVGFIRLRDSSRPAPSQRGEETRSVRNAPAVSESVHTTTRQTTLRADRAARKQDPATGPSTEKIVATILSGNNEEIVGDAVRSAIDWVDEILLIDTGITDGTVELVKELAGEKFRQTQFTWCNDFALARNTALEEAAAHGATWALTLDTDERLVVDGFRTRSELRLLLAGEPQITAWLVSDRGGTYAKERLVRVPSKQQWKGRTHETLVGASARQRKVLPGVRFYEVGKTPEAFHHKLERDLVILLQETRDKPNNARWWYYLGQTFDGLQRNREAADAYRHCATLDGWAEEAAWACYQAAKCLSGLKEFQEAIHACALGLARQPGSPELAWLAGHCCYEMGQHRKAIHWEQMAIALGNVEGSKAGERRIGFRHLPGWYEGPYDVLRYAYRKIGMEAEANAAEANYQRAREMRLASRALSDENAITTASEAADEVTVTSASQAAGDANTVTREGDDANTRQPLRPDVSTALAAAHGSNPPAHGSRAALRRVVMRTKIDDAMKLDSVSQEFHDSAVYLRNSDLLPSDNAYNLTVSHERRFLWFRVAKVATRTILNHLRENCGPLDMDHAMSVHYPINLCRDYFKFGFVRNPWERLVSCWQNKVVDTNYFRFDESNRQRLMDFKNFVEYVRELDVETCDHHLRLQRKLIDLNQIEFLGRLEAFEEDFSHVCDVLGIPALQGQQRNKSARSGDLHEYYTPDLIDAVADIYRTDIQLLNYTFE